MSECKACDDSCVGMCLEHALIAQGLQKCPTCRSVVRVVGETTQHYEPAEVWGVFDTWERRWCPRRGTEAEMGAHAVKLNDGKQGREYRYQPLPLPAPIDSKAGA